MGEAELIQQTHTLCIRSCFFFYGIAAGELLAQQVANDIEQHWNHPGAVVSLRGDIYKLRFDIKGIYAPLLTPLEIFENTNPRNNYFRIEETSPLEVSFVDGIGCNTGYFLLRNLQQDSTTAAHEYGHTLGLIHPRDLDIRGKGVPGIMYPRGTITDAAYQYNPAAIPGDNRNGGTMDPLARQVKQHDIDLLKLHRLNFNKEGFAVVGDFSSLWHEAYD